MSELNRFLRNMLNDELNNLHTSMPCKVERFDEDKGTADVVPLIMKNNQKRPLLVEIPVLTWKYKSGEDEEGDPIFTELQLHLEAGDVVMCIFSERPHENAIKGKFDDPGNEVRHSLGDAVIIGVI